MDLVSLALVAAAVVLAVSSGSPLLALAAICGACGVATLLQSSTEVGP